MTSKKKLDAVFALGQLQGVKLAIELTDDTAKGKRVTELLQDIYECLIDYIDSPAGDVASDE